MEYFERLREVARVKKIDQADLARNINISPSTISKWWNNKQVPGTKNSQLLADYFGCSVEWLTTGKGEMFTSYQPPVGNTINFAMGKKSTDLPPKLEQMMTWISEQDDGRDYWAWMEMEFSEKFEGYRKWIKEQQQEKKQKTGTDI